MQIITTSNTQEIDVSLSEFKLESQIVDSTKTATDTSWATGSLPEFKKIVAGFIQPDQCENAIAIIQKSKLGKAEKDNRIDLLTNKSNEIVGCIQRVAAFENTTEEYNGFLLEQVARYDDNVQGFIITASHPEHGLKVFIDKACLWSEIKRDAKKWVDSFMAAPTQELHQEDEEPTLSRDSEAEMLLSRLIPGQEIWVGNRKGEFRAFDNAMADVIFCGTEDIEQVHGLDISLSPKPSPEPERAINPTESQILEFIQSSTSPTSDSQIAEALGMTEIAVRGFARNLIQFGLISSSVDEDGETWYFVKSAAVEVCQEMERIVRVEHDKNLAVDDAVLLTSDLDTEIELQVEELPFTDYDDSEVPLTEDQAMSIVDEINRDIVALKGIVGRTRDRVRINIQTLDIGKGYLALGFENMSALFESDLFAESRSTCQKEWQVGRVEKALGKDTGTLVLDHGLKLFPVFKKKPEKLEEVYRAAIEEAGTESNLNVRCIRDAIAQVAPDLKPKPKPKSKVVRDGGSRRFDVVLPGMKIQVQNDDTIHDLLELDRPVEEVICQGAIELIMEMMDFTLREEAIAYLVGREKNKNH